MWANSDDSGWNSFSHPATKDNPYIEKDYVIGDTYPELEKMDLNIPESNGIDMTSYVVSGESRNERTEITLRFPGLFSFQYEEHWAPTFGKILDYIRSNSIIVKDLKEKLGEAYESALTNVVVTVKTKTEGHEYNCNFINKTFDYIKVVPNLEEERIKREEEKKAYVAAKRIFRLKQTGRILLMVAIGATWYHFFVSGAKIAEKIEPGIILTEALMFINIMSAKLHFEVSGGKNV